MLERARHRRLVPWTQAAAADFPPLFSGVNPSSARGVYHHHGGTRCAPLLLRAGRPGEPGELCYPASRSRCGCPLPSRDRSGNGVLLIRSGTDLIAAPGLVTMCISPTNLRCWRHEYLSTQTRRVKLYSGRFRGLSTTPERHAEGEGR